MQEAVGQCVIVILAAGESKRMGNPKQLLPYKNKNLLVHSITEAIQTGIGSVIVVLGASSDLIKKEIGGLKVQIVQNENWQEGIASSLRCGLAAARQINPATDGIIFMVCDQPFVTALLLSALVKTQLETGQPIVASNYGNELGTPALFHKSLFNKLMELEGDTGARKLIRQQGSRVAAVAFAAGHIDMDTPEDYEKC